MNVRRVRLGAAAIFAGLIAVAGQTSAEAATGDEQAAGGWTVTVDIASHNLPPSFEQKSGTRTYFFGEGCALGSGCTITRTNQDGETVEQKLSGGSTFTWESSTPLDCTNTLTGEVSTPHGADFLVNAELRPTTFEERDGVRWVTGMSGTIVATLAVNPKGIANDCTIPPNDALTVTDRGTLSAIPVPLAAPPSGSSGRPLALQPDSASAEGTVPAFTLPLSSRQKASRAAVDDGRRSSVPGAVMAPADAVKNVGDRLPGDLLMLAALGLLMVFPAQLFNSTYEENHERVEAGLRRLRFWHRTPTVATEAAVPSRGRRLAVFAGCLVAGAGLGGLLDPGFGANTPSYALVVGVIASILVGIGVALAAGWAFRGTTHRDHHWYLRAIPTALGIAVLCVLISRLVGFEPGYLYGLIGGAVFIASLERRQEGRAELAVCLGALLLVGLAWVAFGPVADAANGSDPSFVTLVTDSFLGSLFVGGLEGLMFSLIPLRFLPGYRVKNASWVVWAVLTAVVLYAFVHVLLRPESGYLGRSTEASVTLTIVLFGLFGVGSAVFWLWFRMRPTAPDEPPAASAADPVTAMVGADDEVES